MTEYFTDMPKWSKEPSTKGTRTPKSSSSSRKKSVRPRLQRAVEARAGSMSKDLEKPRVAGEETQGRSANLASAECRRNPNTSVNDSKPHGLCLSVPARVHAAADR